LVPIADDRAPKNPSLSARITAFHIFLGIGHRRNANVTVLPLLLKGAKHGSRPVAGDQTLR